MFQVVVFNEAVESSGAKVFKNWEDRLDRLVETVSKIEARNFAFATIHLIMLWVVVTKYLHQLKEGCFLENFQDYSCRKRR